MRDIYGNRKAEYEKELGRVSEWSGSSRNKELLFLWHEHLFADGSGKIRVAKLSGQLRRIMGDIGKDFDGLVKSDVVSLLASYNRREEWSEATKADYRRCLKQFFSWFEDEDKRLLSDDRNIRFEAQQFYRHLKENVSLAYKQKKIEYSEILTDNDIWQVISKGARSVKEKAFLSVLHEGGLRAGELLNIRLKDIESKDTHTLLQVDGKTGRRRVTLVRSVVYLSAWLEFHPFRDDPSAFLWVNESPRKVPSALPINHGGAQRIIDRCFARAGVKKKHNLHWFRHSRATLLASKLPEATLCKYFGWVLGSRQIRTYVHLGGKQVENAVLGLHGIATQEDEEKIKVCACGVPNDAHNRYCRKCGRALDITTVEKEKEYLAKAFEVLPKIMGDPKMRKEFESRMK